MNELSGKSILLFSKTLKKLFKKQYKKGYVEVEGYSTYCVMYKNTYFTINFLNKKNITVKITVENFYNKEEPTKLYEQRNFNSLKKVFKYLKHVKKIMKLKSNYIKTTEFSKTRL